MSDKKYYVLSGTKSWADEFDVYFFEILTEDDYQKYKAAKEILGSLYGSYCFGSNQSWDGTFNYLSFTAKQITEEQYEFLESLHIRGRPIIEDFIEHLWYSRSYAGLENIDLYEASLEDFKKACIELRNLEED